MQPAEEAVPTEAERQGHRRWVRISHWTTAVSFLALLVSGVLILAVHPRLYWGEVGNDLTPALFEIPISNNHQPSGWERTVSFRAGEVSSFSANRNYAIFNQNGWARSLHFLAAWVLVITGAFYALLGLISGHVGRHLLPRGREMALSRLWRDVLDHAKRRFDASVGGPPYGPLQRLAYFSVMFVALPLMVVTGLTMSPAVSAAFPALLDVFGGYQSARTIHFFGFSALLLFLVAHLAMVLLTGVRRQLRAMILGS